MEQDYKADFILTTNAQLDVTVGTILSVEQLRLRGFKFIWHIEGGSGAARTRNLVTTKFLQQNLAPFLIIVDRDIVFSPEDIGFLLEDLRNEYDLVGGCYAVKNGTQLATIGLDKGDIDLDGTVKEVQWLATGFLGVSRRLIQRMVERLELPLMHQGQWSEAYPFFGEFHHYDATWGWMWLTEDYAFCEKARAVGTRPYLDTRIWVGHIGNKQWDVLDVIKYCNKDRIAEQVKALVDRSKGRTVDNTAPKASIKK